MKQVNAIIQAFGELYRMS